MKKAAPEWLRAQPCLLSDDAGSGGEIEAIGVWYAGCTDYYRAPSGRIVTQWPRTMSEHREMLNTLDLDAWETGGPAGGAKRS